MLDYLLKNTRLDDVRELQDIAIQNGKIVKISNFINDPAEHVIDVQGKVVIPGLVESHIHLDKALIADRLENRSGTLQEAIKVTAQLKPTFTSEDVYERASKTLMMLVQKGVTHMRTHSEFDPEQGFVGFDVVLRLKEEFKDLIDIQVVAFPQEGIEKAPSTLEMMHQAIAKGADVVGGIPYNDLDPNDHIDLVFEIAKQYDLDIDLHQDFKDDSQGMSIEYLCNKTISEGYQGRVSVGHLTALGALPNHQLQPIVDLMRKADINVMSLPATDLHLGGRNDDGNVRRALTPISKLRKSGVNVCIATNNIRNAFTPYGNGDIFLTAMFAISAGHLGGADDLKTVLSMLTTNPARALKLPNYGIYEGANADLVVLESEKVSDVVIDLPQRLYVFKNGRLTVKSEQIVEVYRY